MKTDNNQETGVPGILHKVYTALSTLTWHQNVMYKLLLLGRFPSRNGLCRW